MTDAIWNLTAGCLLRDVGKILAMGTDSKDRDPIHRFLEETGFSELKEIVEAPDQEEDEGSFLPMDSLAYIALMADRMTDDESSESTDDMVSDTVRGKPLMSLFNRLNGNKQSLAYQVNVSGKDGNIAYPEEIQCVEHADYDKLAESLKKGLNLLNASNHSVNGVLEGLEDHLSQVPSTSKVNSSDISMFDRAKLRAAVARAIFEYTQSNGLSDLKQLSEKESDFKSQKVFLLYSFDVSGIQDFIYTIPSKGALKNLRARSFYLEIMVEHLIDELLDTLGHSRISLIYAGGGHAYLLLANTKQIKEVIGSFEKNTQQWFLQHFKNALYIAGGFSVCSAMELKNKPKGSYSEIFRTISTQISEKKLNRYSAEEIRLLNNEKPQQGERECSVCRRSDRLIQRDKRDICDICAGLEMFSSSILNESIFVICRTRLDQRSLPLPGGKYLLAVSEAELRELARKGSDFIRGYSKNNRSVEGHSLTRLWVGDYFNEQSFEKLAESSQGIKRIAVLRADVDNLGQAFVSGFENEREGDNYVNLSRTSAFSRKVSMFFKYHINYLLENPEFHLDCSRGNEPRHAAIVYSGGDDAFIVGSWDDVIGFIVDLHRSLKQYSQGTLSISGGIGIYPPKFPINVMARQSGELEAAAKSLDAKKAVALFSKDQTYHLEDFIDQVLGEKFTVIQRFFDTAPDRGISFMYNLLDLLKNRQDRISLPRFAYLLARMKPAPTASQAEKDEYQIFAEKMFQWMKQAEDSRQAITAIQIYAYLVRMDEEE